MSNQGKYSPQLRKEFLEVCTMANIESKECKNVRNLILHEIGVTNLNVYDIYGTCYHEKYPSSQFGNSRYFDQYMFKKQTPFKSIIERMLLKSNEIPPCSDSLGVLTFMNNATIKKNIHADRFKGTWGICNQSVNINYQLYPEGSYWIYKELINEGLRIMVYSGDVDAAVPYTGTKWWINLLAGEKELEVTNKWKSWYIPAEKGRSKKELQVGGNFVQFKENFTFVTVRGAGHMVPQFTPKAAYIMMTSYLKNEKLPGDQ